MTLPNHINDREYNKFEEVSGQPAVRVTGTNFSGSFSLTGLTVGGRISIVSIDNTTWTALPATALPNRNQLNIQNESGQNIKINYDNMTVGFVGVLIKNENERQYAIRDSIVMYAKSETSACNITVEELA